MWLRGNSTTREGVIFTTTVLLYIILTHCLLGYFAKNVRGTWIANINS